MRDEETLCSLSRSPDADVRSFCQPFLRNRIGIVSQFGKHPDQSGREVLVKFDLHAICGTLGIGRSSTAEVAAKAITARTARPVRVEKSSRSSWVLAPSAKLARIVRTVTRVPLTTGPPPQIVASRAIYSS